MNGWLEGFYWFLGISGFIGSTRTILALKDAKNLPPLDDPIAVALASTPFAPSSQPKVSVVMAVRDEASRIEGTLQRILAQRDVHLEVIVVNDRSTDATAEIIRSVAARDSRIRIIEIESLPANWLGKCHACHVGAAAAMGDWILFTEGDVWLQEDVVRRALRVAEKESADHIAVAGSTRDVSIAVQGWHLLFMVGIAGWIQKVNRDDPRAFLGIGTFNLVRTSSYRKCGGYEALRMTAVDDVKLGLLLHRSGARTRAYIGGKDVDCEWSAGARGIVKLVEKYYFAALNYNTTMAFGGVMVMGFLWLMAFSGFFTGSWAGLFAGVGLLSFSIPAALCARQVGWPKRAGLAMPWAIPVFLYANLNSAIVTLRAGGIRWRETFYPLEVLRRENVQ
jgi:glycosyltransferase involved in cell wall biosynthesis